MVEELSVYWQSSPAGYFLIPVGHTKHNGSNMAGLIHRVGCPHYKKGRELDPAYASILVPCYRSLDEARRGARESGCADDLCPQCITDRPS